MVGTSDQSCWLAEACKILVLLLQFTGQVNLPKAGLWSFSLSSDDGSILYIDGGIFINNDGGYPHPISVLL